MPDHTTTSAAAYLTERGYKVHSKRDGTDLPPSPGTIKQWCERGKIKARKAGWAWLISQETLDELLRKDKTMNLIIHVTPNGTTGLELAAFPFNDGQYIESETPGEGEVLVSINLGEYTDTTAAQEEYLNTNPNVVNYGVYD